MKTRGAQVSYTKCRSTMNTIGRKYLKFSTLAAHWSHLELYFKNMNRRGISPQTWMRSEPLGALIKSKILGPMCWACLIQQVWDQDWGPTVLTSSWVLPVQRLHRVLLTEFACGMTGVWSIFQSSWSNSVWTQAGEPLSRARSLSRCTSDHTACLLLPHRKHSPYFLSKGLSFSIQF